jgi:hypothetical protein
MAHEKKELSENSRETYSWVNILMETEQDIRPNSST